MKKAFTLLELIFVIVVIGILAAVILPSRKSNSLAQAANQLISDIRYTQHLAIVDDMYDKNKAHWYRGRWQLIYSHSNSSDRDTGGYYAYTIFSDSKGAQTGNPDLSEMAVNPLNSDKLLSGGYSGGIDWEDKRATKRMNIGYKYGISNITKSSGCTAQNIAFDNKGRPYSGDDHNWNSVTDGIMKKPCTFTLYHGDKNISITIEPETGYVHL